MDFNFLQNNYHHQRRDGSCGDESSVPGLGLGGGIPHYRSAPSSCFSDFVGRVSPDVDFLCRQSSPETEQILERFISGTAESLERGVQSGNGEFRMTMKREEEVGEGFTEQGRYSSPVSREMGIQYMVAGGGAEATRVVPVKGGYLPSGLARHSSSPAWLFDDTSIDGRNVSIFNGPMSTIHEIGRKNVVEVITSTSASSYLAGFPASSLDGQTKPGNLFPCRQRDGNDDVDAFSCQIAEEVEEEEERRGQPLSYHLSPPKKTSIDVTAIESFLQPQDSVPCKVRAKRGFATHPRSIAERVRRTKISERIRKLQDLVPNMDRQTNTADMLDLALDYIKDLQGKVKTLSENRARCECSITKFS